jgi:hypothetical protein
VTEEIHASNETDRIVDLLISDLPEEVLLMMAMNLSRGALNPTVVTAHIRNLKPRIAMRKEPDRGGREGTMTLVKYRAIVAETL